MMSLNIEPIQHSQILTITDPRWPLVAFKFCIPEAIGDVDHSVWGSTPDYLMEPAWGETAPGRWQCAWRKDGCLAFTAAAQAHGDYVDVALTLTNLGQTAWAESTAFMCLNPSEVLHFSDHEGPRTFLLLNGAWTPITQIPRRHSERPTIQLWHLRGKPRPLRFVTNFKADPEVYPEGVLAVRSVDGRDLIAVSADTPLFLFGNLEFACIHACPSFGALEPGEQGRALCRFFLLENAGFEELETRLDALWGRA